MQTGSIETFFWLLGCFLYGTLCGAIRLNHSYKALPIFSLWIANAFLTSSVLYLFNRYATAKHYTEAYWLFALLEIVLQIAVALEFADKAFRHEGMWVQGTRLPFSVCGVAGGLLSGAVALSAHPAAVGALELYYTRVGLLTSMLMFLLSVSTLAIAYTCGSLWRPFHLYHFLGFLIWSTASSIIDTMHVHPRMTSHFAALDAIHLSVSDIVILYWIVASFYPRKRGDPKRERNELEALTALYSMKMANPERAR